MDRKEIKKERTRRYFLDAAKEIIRAEGVSALTTKKIGDRAAYSYASIYNYFENFNELVCLCLEEMAAECAQRVRERLCGDRPRERILSFARLMIEENAANPHVYSVFLSTDIDYSYFQRRDGHPFAHPAYALLLSELEHLPTLRENKDGDAARMLADILTYVFHAKLHFYIRYGTPASLDRLCEEVLAETNFILDGVEQKSARTLPGTAACG